MAAPREPCNGLGHLSRGIRDAIYALADQASFINKTRASRNDADGSPSGIRPPSPQPNPRPRPVLLLLRRQPPRPIGDLPRVVRQLLRVRPTIRCPQRSRAK